jgi:hypothetical protein
LRRILAIVDRTGMAASAVMQAGQEKSDKELFDKETHRQIAPRHRFESVPPDADAAAQRLALSNRVRSGQLYAFLEIGPANLHPTKNAVAAPVHCYNNASTFDNAGRWLERPLNDGLRRVRLAQLGVSASHFDDTLAVPWKGSVSFPGMTRPAKSGKLVRKAISTNSPSRSDSCACSA